jgi:hypothetical protein
MIATLPDFDTGSALTSSSTPVRNSGEESLHVAAAICLALRPWLMHDGSTGRDESLARETATSGS